MKNILSDTEKTEVSGEKGIEKFVPVPWNGGSNG